MPDKTFRFKRPRKIGKRYQYQDLTFWAKNGFIYVEDRADNSFHTISRRDWVLRANAVVKELGKLGPGPTNADNTKVVDEILRHTNKRAHVLMGAYGIGGANGA